MRDKKNFLRYWVNLVLTQRLCVTKTQQSHRAYETQNFCQKTHKWYFSVLYWWTEWCWVTRRLQNTALPWFICSLSTCRACIASKAVSKVELISVGRLWLEVTHSDPLTAALWLCRQRDWDNRHHLCEVAQIVTANDQKNMSKSGEVTRWSTSHCWGSSNEHDLRTNSKPEAKLKRLNSGLFQNCGCSRKKKLPEKKHLWKKLKFLKEEKWQYEFGRGGL